MAECNVGIYSNFKVEFQEAFHSTPPASSTKYVGIVLKYLMGNIIKDSAQDKQSFVSHILIKWVVA